MATTGEVNIVEALLKAPPLTQAIAQARDELESEESKRQHQINAATLNIDEVRTGPNRASSREISERRAAANPCTHRSTRMSFIERAAVGVFTNVAAVAEVSAAIETIPVMKAADPPQAHITRKRRIVLTVPTREVHDLTPRGKGGGGGSGGGPLLAHGRCAAGRTLAKDFASKRLHNLSLLQRNIGVVISTQL